MKAQRWKNDFVDPARLERRAVRQLVMAVVAGRIEHAIGREGGNRPERSPGEERHDAGDAKQREPQREMP